MQTELLFQRAVQAFQTQQYELAENLCNECLSAQPNSGESLHFLGVVYAAQGKHEEALGAYDRASAFSRRNEELHLNRILSLVALRRMSDAAGAAQKLLILAPLNVAAQVAYANILQEMGKYTDAIRQYQKALTLDPRNAESWSNQGRALAFLDRYSEALDCYDRALSLVPNHPGILSNRGDVLLKTKRYADSLQCYQSAASLDPKNARHWADMGMVFLEAKMYPRASEAFEQAWLLDKSIPYLLGARYLARAFDCNWKGQEQSVQEIAECIEQGVPVSMPFPLLSMPISAELRAKGIQAYSAELSQKKALAAPVLESGTKIKIAYFSSDFKNHAVAFLIAGVIESHDREKFEVYGYAIAPTPADEMNIRLQNAFDHFHDLSGVSHESAVRLTREHGIHIAIDLNGYTESSRPQLFRDRVAPIQINYLGFPGMMAADFMDYIIGDELLIPESHRGLYSEKVVYLPDTFQANDSKRVIGPDIDRMQAMLPEKGLVFCCFNNTYKLNPRFFTVWLDLLKQVDGSVLWLLGSSQEQMTSLWEIAEQQGISRERVVFAERVPYAQHLARYKLADLALDTLPFGGGATTSDALWAGVPVLTVLGDDFAGRMSASLLNAVGTPELITRSLDEYADKAVSLAQDVERLASLKHKIAEARVTSPLFNTAAFTRHLEVAYTTMIDRCRNGLQPDHIHVSR